MTDRQAIAHGAGQEPRRRTRLPLLMTVVLIVCIGALVGWSTAKYLTGRIADKEAVDVKLPSAKAPIASSPPAATKRSVAARTVNEATPAPLPIEVNSYPLSVGYALNEWSSGTGNSGYLDGGSANGRPIAGNQAASLGEADVIELTGWAGDAELGVRYPFVLISACGKVVAHADVSGLRTDVAAAVHPNLSRSGWRARIAARHLPTCDGMALRAWGVAPGDRKLILPLDGRKPVSVARPKVGRALQFDTAASPIRPSDMKPLAPIRLAVRTSMLNMRRCASTKCKVIGRLNKGELTALTLDDAGDWLLIAMADRAGWIAKRFVVLDDATPVQVPR